MLLLTRSWMTTSMYPSSGWLTGNCMRSRETNGPFPAYKYHIGFLNSIQSLPCGASLYFNGGRHDFAAAGLDEFVEDASSLDPGGRGVSEGDGRSPSAQPSRTELSLGFGG